jgi:hypothetical protein
MAITEITEVARKTNPLRAEVHWVDNERRELDVCHIPIEHLYFNIENGRYADRMIRLRRENPGVEIDPKLENWKTEIEKMLAGEHKDTSKDKAAFEKLREDIMSRSQLRPGVVTIDGGVVDGNRRLAALRRLNVDSRDKFRDFDGVILPRDTTAEDRWRIEAGLQLGVNERWDYSPINELLKVRAGVVMYEEMIRTGKLKKDADPIQVVAKAIYGKADTQIKEMMSRLDLIDEYLRFIKLPGAYDTIGPLSERFLEATRIVQAAENSNHDPAFLAKLKSALFYTIDRQLMDNWELRKIYGSLGGDPKKRGPKPKMANANALREFLGEFPEPKKIQEALVADHFPAQTTKAPPPAKGAFTDSEGVPPKAQTEHSVDKAKLEAATEKFIRTMEATAQSKTPRKIAAGASAEIAALHDGLGMKEVREAMTVDDRKAVLGDVTSMQTLLGECLKQLKKA